MSSLAEQLAIISNPIVNEWKGEVHKTKHTADLRPIPTTPHKLIPVPGPKEPHQPERPSQTSQKKRWADINPNKGRPRILSIIRSRAGMKRRGAS